MFLSAKPGWLGSQRGESHTGSPVWIAPHVCISVCTCSPWISQDPQSLLWWFWKDHGGCEPTRTQEKTPGGWRTSDGDSPPTVPGCLWVTLTHLGMSLGCFLEEENSLMHLGHYPESMSPFPFLLWLQTNKLPFSCPFLRKNKNNKVCLWFAFLQNWVKSISAGRNGSARM